MNWEHIAPFFFFLLGFVLSNVWHWWQLRRWGRRLIGLGVAGPRTASGLGRLVDPEDHGELTQEEEEEAKAVEKLQAVLAEAQQSGATVVRPKPKETT